MALAVLIFSEGFESTIVIQTRVSNGTGQCNFSGQRDRKSFIVPGQRDNGTSSKSCHGTGRDGILNRLSRPVPGRPGTKSLSDCQKKMSKKLLSIFFFFFSNYKFFTLFFLLSRGCPFVPWDKKIPSHWKP
jgi:hypothetical protein